MSRATIRVNHCEETIRRQLTGAPVSVAISGATARSSQLSLGDYFVKTTVDCYVKQGTSAVNAATTDYWLRAGEEWIVHVDDTTANGYIAAITGGAAGTLLLKPVEAI